MSVRPLKGNGIRLQLLHEREHVGSALVFGKYAAVEPYLKQFSVVAPQLCQLLRYDTVVFFLSNGAAFLHTSRTTDI